MEHDDKPFNDQSIDSRPLVLLDVDGVINDLGALSHQPRSWRIDEVPSHGWVLHIPDYMQQLIADLVATAEVWWCTTWRGGANDELVDFLGIDPLPVIDHESWGRTVDWKSAGAYPVARAALDLGREVFWIEDFYGEPPTDAMPNGVVFIDTAADTEYPVLTEDMLPARLQSAVVSATIGNGRAST
jgi:hypothetical protein